MPIRWEHVDDRDQVQGLTTGGNGMKFMEGVAQVRDAMSVKRVFGEPYEQDGVTIIPVAWVAGGGGGGGDAEGNGGGGFGLCLLYTSPSPRD